MWQTYGDDEAAVRPVGAARARLETAAVQAPPAARHLHQSRRSRGHGDRAAARRPAAAGARQSGRDHAQSHGPGDRILKETSKTHTVPFRHHVACSAFATHYHRYLHTRRHHLEPAVWCVT